MPHPKEVHVIRQGDDSYSVYDEQTGVLMSKLRLDQVRLLVEKLGGTPVLQDLR